MSSQLAGLQPRHERRSSDWRTSDELSLVPASNRPTTTGFRFFPCSDRRYERNVPCASGPFPWPPARYSRAAATQGGYAQVRWAPEWLGCHCLPPSPGETGPATKSVDTSHDYSDTIESRIAVHASLGSRHFHATMCNSSAVHENSQRGGEHRCTDGDQGDLPSRHAAYESGVSHNRCPLSRDRRR
jgi:hypothetical protein